MICSGTVSVRAVASVTMRRTRACPCEESHTGVCYSSRTNHPELCPSRISCTNGISSKSCAPFCLTCVCTRAAYVPAMHCRVAKPLNLTASNSRCVLNEAGLWVSILRASQQRRGEHEIELLVQSLPAYHSKDLCLLGWTCLAVAFEYQVGIKNPSTLQTRTVTASVGSNKTAQVRSKLEMKTTWDSQEVQDT